MSVTEGVEDQEACTICLISPLSPGNVDDREYVFQSGSVRDTNS